MKILDLDWDGKGTVAHAFFCLGCGQNHAAIEGRWTFNGNYEKPTLSPSIMVTAPYMGEIENYVCHSFVTNGEIQYLNDCTHKFAGQTIELPDFEE